MHSWRNFNSHAHVERDSDSIFVQRWYSISTHTLTWSVTCWQLRSKADWQFQLTRSRGAWHCISPIKMADNTFQLTRSRGAWHVTNNTNRVKQAFQLTRSRGAWLEKRENLENIDIFQLTRSRGAWHGFKNKTMELEHFNSHAHVERDVWNLWITRQLYISTHTLTWSVTSKLIKCEHLSIISTHTLTWSVTPWRLFYKKWV